MTSRTRWIAFIGVVIVLGVVLLITERVRRGNSDAADALLRQADAKAWLGDWGGAAPLFARAERLFYMRRDSGRALYARVSQIPSKIETESMPDLIAAIDEALNTPAAQEPRVRLRILTVLGLAEVNYDASMAKTTWAEVEQLALQQHQWSLASRALGEQGIQAFLLGDMKDAKTKVTRAYLASRVLGDAEAHVRYASVYGDGLAELGMYEQSLKWCDEAIDLASKTPGMPQPTIAERAKIAALAGLGRYSEAFLIVERAERYPAAHALYGQLYALESLKADVYEKKGDNQRAIDGYRSALEYAKRLNYWRGLTESGGLLAAVYEKAGDFPNALNAIDAALRANAHVPDERYFLPRNTARKAEIEQHLGKPEVAEQLYRKSEDMIDALLTKVPTPMVERTLMTELGDVYSGHFSLLVNSGHLNEALRVIESAHGRIEAQSLQTHATLTPGIASPADKELNALQLQILNTDDDGARKVLLSRMYDLETASASAFNAAVTTKPVSLPELQRTLNAGESLVEFVLAKPKSYGLVITHTSVHCYELKDKDVLEGEAQRYRAVVHSRKADLGLAQQVEADLFGQMAEVRNAKAVFVVPDGQLYLLPFGALANASGYLVFQRSMNAVPSGTVLALLRKKAVDSDPGEKRTFLGVAPWVVPDKGSFLLASNPRGSGSESPTKWDLLPLPESKREVEAIREMLPEPSTVLIGQAATKLEFERLPLRDYDVLHLALHGYADPDFPDRSALIFASSKGDPGFLRVRDIRGMRLDASLVTLSACNTGVGPVGASGISNLGDAFLQTGAQTVVSTLWEVDDESTAGLMKQFYEALSQGQEKREALRAAQAELANSGVLPYYWATFEMLGDGSAPINVRGKRSRQDQTSAELHD